MRCEFYNTENLDGYFSGVLYFYTENKRYILEFGFDIEFNKIAVLKNCNDPVWNSYGDNYSDEELVDLQTVYYSDIYYAIKNEI